MEAHILVVDDDAAIRELVREYLAEHDYKVSVAETGADMDKVLASGDIVDLVILDLTNSEYALLVAFLRAPKKVLSRDQLLESSRLHDDIYDRSIDVQILRLRRKIEDSPNQPKLIRTERGAGYYLDSAVETV